MIKPGTACLCVTHSPLVTRVIQAALRSPELAAARPFWTGTRPTRLPAAGLDLEPLAGVLFTAFKEGKRAEYHRNLRRLRDGITALTGGKFVVLLPHNNQLIFQELLAHPDCTGYYFVEEGFTSMSWKHWPKASKGAGKGAIARWKRAWVGSHYKLQRPMFDVLHPSFKGGFAISAAAFLGMEGRCPVSSLLPAMAEGTGPAQTLVALDSSYVHRNIDWNDYQSALLHKIREVPDARTPLRIKFHFSDCQAPRHFEELVAGCNRLGLPRPELLDATFCLEDALTRKDLLVFGVSSLGYYANLWGGRAVSFAPLIKGLHLDDWIHRRLLPPDFTQVAGISGEP